MAIGGVPTMMDMDWATINANQRAKNMQNFKSEFLNNIKQEVMALKPKLTWDGSNLKYENATDGSDNMLRAMTEEELWNRYSTAAKNKGIKTDLVYFENELKPVYQAMSTNSLSRQLQDFSNRGLDPKHFKKLYKSDANFKKSLDYTINNTTDPTMQEGFRTLRPSIQSGIGIGQGIGIGLGGILGGRTIDKFAKAQALKNPDSMIGKYGRGAGPLAALLGIPMAASAMGASEEQMKAIGMSTSIGVPAYYGMKTGSEVMKNKLLTSSLKGNRADLMARAKKLGIEDIIDKGKGKTPVSKIQEKMFSKIKSQPAIKSMNQLGKRHLKTPRVGGAPFAPKNLRVKGGGKLGLALSLLYPLITGEWFGDGKKLAPETEDTRQAFDWSTSEYAKGTR